MILRPRFGELCFLCEVNPVPAPRAEALKRHAAERGRPWLKSDLLCVECEQRGDRVAMGLEPSPLRR
jgi:hypothetical protein